MSVTRWVVGSQLTPYQLTQQSLPVHELKMPKYGSLSAALKDSSAARSDGVQDITAEVTENITVTTNRKEAIVARSFLSE